MYMCSPVPAVLECVHDTSAVRKVQYGQKSERQLDTLEDVQPVVHHVQLFASQNSHHDCWRHGDHPGNEYTAPFWPVYVEKTLKP